LAISYFTRTVLLTGDVVGSPGGERLRDECTYNEIPHIKVEIKQSHERLGQALRVPGFQDNRHMKVLKLSA